MKAALPGMQSKATMIYRLTPVMLAVIKKAKGKCCHACGEGNLHMLLVGIQISKPFVGNNMGVPHKTKHGTTWVQACGAEG